MRIIERVCRLERLAAVRDFDPPALARIACQVYATGAPLPADLDEHELAFIGYYVGVLRLTEMERQFAPDAPCPGHWSSS